MARSRSRSCSAAVLVAALATALAGQKEAKEPSSYDTALARYHECMKRKALTHQTEGRKVLATTRRPEALKILIADYAEAKAYPEYSRYTLATLFGRNFDGAPCAVPLAALRQACSKPVDTWLWVNSLGSQIRADSGEQALAIVHDDKNLLHKAAAIVALGQTRSAALSPAIVTVCAGFPAREADRNLLLGAMSGAILENKSKANDEQFRKGLVAYIGLLAPAVKLTAPAKLQIARHLQWTLGGPAQFVDPESWLALLQHGDVKPRTSGNTVTQPRFFGIESEGERLCYVIDMSDSMCKEIAPGVRPKGAVTGVRKKKDGLLPDESDLPWDRIRTRFDLVRENLRISLQRLGKDKHFCIVWFGDESGTLESCKGMVPATRSNVDRVMVELDAIPTGRPDPVKAPDGVLRGKTNMHSGLRRAFGLSTKGFVDEVAYVDPSTLTEGCDTIFLLTDGVPSWDDFHVQDKDYGEGKTIVDSEYGAAAPRTPITTYWGPYNDPEWLVEDVARMNAFRRVRIHCIGFGEANMQFLDRLAAVGHGDTFEVGNKKGDGK